MIEKDIPDCGDNSCLFKGRGAGGQRTNGGCRCSSSTVKRYLDNKIKELEEQQKILVDALKTVVRTYVEERDIGIAREALMKAGIE